MQHNTVMSIPRVCVRTICTISCSPRVNGSLFTIASVAKSGEGDRRAMTYGTCNGKMQVKLSCSNPVSKAEILENDKHLLRCRDKVLRLHFNADLSCVKVSGTKHSISQAANKLDRIAAHFTTEHLPNTAVYVQGLKSMSNAQW